MTPSSPRLSRRQFFTQLATGAKAVPLPLLHTPNEHFFHSMTPQVPRLNTAYWSLTIAEGIRVTHPVTWSYDDLMTLPMTELEATLLCATNAPGGERIGHARWRGVPISALLAHGNFLPAKLDYVDLEGADGHVTSISSARLMDAVLAFEMNGQPLTAQQGFPARLIVPGVYDHKMPRWIEHIKLIDYPLYTRWERKGYDAEGVVKTTAAITSHRPHEKVGGRVTFEGYAFAGDRAIALVEISIDGSVWTAIAFTSGPRWSWSRWSLDWQPSSAGEHAVAIRATDENGQVQATAHNVALRVVL